MMGIKKIVDIISASDKAYPESIFGDNHKLCTCVNSAGYLLLRKDYGSYEKFDGIFIDGIWMCIFLRIFWNKKIKRRSFDMTSIARDLFERLNDKDNNETVYFIGSRQDQVKASVGQFVKNYPDMKVIGFRNGYFRDDEERAESIREIVRLNPAYTIIGLGKPTQDYYGIDLFKAGYRGTVFTCGGFLHQSCENIIYYPEWIHKYNLRSIYRFVREGTWSRLWPDLFHFPFVFVHDRVRALFGTKSGR